MGNWTFGLAGLACLAMMALMCLPMAIGMVRGRLHRSPADTATPPAVPADGQHAAAPTTRSASTSDSRRTPAAPEHGPR